jgi:hypothetical protein
MKPLLALLLLSVTALAEKPPKEEEDKPAAIQDGQAAESYISRTLYEFLDERRISLLMQKRRSS